MRECRRERQRLQLGSVKQFALTMLAWLSDIDLRNAKLRPVISKLGIQSRFVAKQIT